MALARDAAEMLDELRGVRLLDGARGREAVSRKAIVDVLMKLGGKDGLLLSLPEDVAEVSYNFV